MTVCIGVGGQRFEAQMEPDGQLGHWFVIPAAVLKKEALALQASATFTLTRLQVQPEPALPKEFKLLLHQSPSAQATWQSTTTLARIDWVHWMESAKQEATRRQRAAGAVDMLEKGKKRVCCFDPSGRYSKALTSPDSA